MPAHRHSPEHRALGRAARLLRAEAGLSQEALGYRAGLHRNYVGAIERGEINPTFRVLLKLCWGLGVSQSRLIREFERWAACPSTAATDTGGSHARAA